MSLILVSGLINLEVTLRVDSFPIDYAPVRYPFFGVNSTISGVGYNIATALTTLGSSVEFCSLIGHDPAGDLARAALQRASVPAGRVLAQIAQTAHSVIEYDQSGRRAIHVDLKDIQEQVYPQDIADTALANADLAVLCNINFSRPMLERALAMGKPIATDVHVISSLDDSYNQDFMAAAHILFMSNEQLPCPPEEWARQVIQRFGTDIVVIGMGAQGALLAQRNQRIVHVPAVKLRPIVSTIGAGDALLSAFIHSYLEQGDPITALHKAVIFASYKIGTAGAADGFISAPELERLYKHSGSNT